MQLLVTKALAAGFAVSMAIGGTTTSQMFMLHSFSEGAPNTALPADRQALSPATTYHQNSPIVVFSTTSAKEQNALDSWLKKLVFLESEGKSEIKVLDNNGLHSFGCLQFQMSTFKEFGLKYGLIFEGDALEKIIYDCVLQKEIARRMIEENPSNWRRWYTSVMIRGLGLPPKEKEEPVLLSLNIK